jgi:hypothetical protein
MVAIARDRGTEAVDLLAEALTMARRVGERWLLATSKLNLGLAYLCLGNTDRARAEIGEALRAYEEIGDQRFHARCLGGMNGHGNARGIAAAQSVLANGGAYGKRLLSDAGREQVLRNEVDGVDVVLGIPLRWGLGYALASPTAMNFAPLSSVTFPKVSRIAKPERSPEPLARCRR